MWRLALLLGLAAATPAADDVLGSVSIEVGETVEIEVGYAIGVACDDPETVAAEMRPKNDQTNVVLFTGRREGHTLCRAGTDPFRISYLFDITVRPKPTR
jgi:hypothetical protein